MTFLDHISFPPALSPVALMGAAILTTALLARPRRARAVAPAFVQRRLGLPKGVARWLVIGAVTVAALLALGIDLQGLWSTVVAALSLVAIGFVAMWSILSHMLASILIVVFRPFEVGDRVEIVGDDPVVGEVIDLNPVYTKLRTDDGGTLQVPNNLIEYLAQLDDDTTAALIKKGWPDVFAAAEREWPQAFAGWQQQSAEQT